MLDTKVETITPGIAKRYLASWDGNRSLSQLIVERYARSMRNGEWQLNGESIKFTKDGRMIDGQHRLHGIIQSNTTQKMLVTRGVPYEAFATIDSGKNRSIGDVASIAGVTNANSVSSAARVMMQLELIHEVSDEHSLRPTRAELLDYTLKNNDQLQTSYKAIIRSRVSILLGVAGPIALHAILSKAGLGERADQFFLELGTGLFDRDDVTHYPPYQFRQKLIQLRSGRARFQLPVFVAMTIKAWNAFISGKRLQLLRFSPGETFPKIQLRGRSAAA